MRVLRALLVALVAVCTVASAAPLTFTAPGHAYVGKLDNFPTAEKQFVGNSVCFTGYQVDCSAVQKSYPLVWVTSQNVQYTGAVAVSDVNKWFLGAVAYFYEGSCQSEPKSACAVLDSHTTGTSLDDWYKYYVKEPVLRWEEQGWQTVHRGDTSSMVANKDKTYYNRSGQTITLHIARAHNVGDSGNSIGDIYELCQVTPSRSHCSFADSPGAAEQGELNALHYFYPRTTIFQWFSGDYWSLETPPVSHSDAYEGIPVVLSEVQADLERTYHHLQLMDFSAFDPVPSGDQLESGSYVPPTGTGGTSTSGGSTSGGSAPCVKTDGSTSGNPYDCAPVDNELKCSIIDIPCNLRKLFIPRSSFLKDFFENGKIFAYLHMPTQPADTWTFELGGHEMTIVWSDYPMPEALHGMIKFLIFYAAFFWSLDVFGLPNPFRRTVGGLASDAIKKGLGRKR